MSAVRDPEQIVRMWLEEGPVRLPIETERAIHVSTRMASQRRPALPVPWRFDPMSTPLRIAAAAVAVLVIAVVGINLMASDGSGGVGASATPDPSALAIASPMALPNGPLRAGTYRMNPSSHPAWTACPGAPQPDCDDPAQDALRFVIDVPDGWAGVDNLGLWLADVEAAPPNGASIGFSRGSWLHGDPCRTDQAAPDVAVGPTVEDFVSALTANQRLDVTEPVDVTLAGYPGKYLDLQVPADISRCPTSYFVWEPGIYAQGPAQRWHLWVLDVGGVRVVVQTTDYAETSAEDRADIQAMVDSLRIEP
jgi:hypothetical protein